VIPDAELDAQRLRAQLAELRDDGLRAAMALAARGLGRPDAARVLADELLAMADRRPLPTGEPA
jgi:UDP-N-acetylglucosamine:LPS N-acetylglucosamine transferase